METYSSYFVCQHKVSVKITPPLFSYYLIYIYVGARLTMILYNLFVSFWIRQQISVIRLILTERKTLYCRGAGLRSGESARLPPMFPGFVSWTRRHKWTEFVGSLHITLLREVFLRVHWFSPLLDI